MASIYDSRQRFKLIFIIGATLIAVASLVVSDMLVKSLAQEERLKMEIWSDANRVLTSDDTDLNMKLILRVLEGNTSIPIILWSEKDGVIYQNNIDLPEKNPKKYLEKKLQVLKGKNPPIKIIVEGGEVQYLYYDDSIILKRLNMYPYIQLAIVFVFILIAFLALSSTKKAEQNKVWVGLSKETAHQLGTPISSLIAWMEYLKTKEMDPGLLNEMEKDVVRLQIIAERFSKIGSNPDPVPVNISLSLQQALDYMRKRISAKVKIQLLVPEAPVLVLMNESLFAWVIENLTKNAVDAMEGQGEIVFEVKETDKIIRIDVTDTGKGIPKSRFKTIFNPGFTTKERGWGLGLSLVKRIVESYTKGKIFVQRSEVGKGTTFRIELMKYKG